MSTSTVRLQTFAREPAKVIRTTFSEQKNCIAKIEYLEAIPDGFMRLTNYLDVTNNYWQVADIQCNTIQSVKQNSIVFASVFNYKNWRPTWWGKNNNGTVSFSNMTKGVVYLPSRYSHGKLESVGFPFALGYNNKKELKPTTELRTVVLKEQDKYLIFRKDKKYDLFYWNNQWVLVGTKIAENLTTELIFDNVPKNALLLLIPEYSQNKERPFIIEDDGTRVWF